MARPLRVEYPGAYYHVMNRGNRRQTVFGSEVDVNLFLEKTGEFASTYHVKILCYCLMHNILFLSFPVYHPNAQAKTAYQQYL